MQNKEITPKPNLDQEIVSAAALAQEFEQRENEKRSLPAKLAGGLAVAGAVAALGFELTPANEALRITPGVEVFRDTGSELKAAAVVTGLTVAIEAPASILFSVGLDRENERVKGIINKIDEWLKFLNKEDYESEYGHKSFDKSQANSEQLEQEEDAEKNDLKEKISDSFLAFGAGSLVVIAKKHYQNPDRELKDNLKTGAKSTSVLAGFSGVIAYATGWIIENGQKLGFFEEPAEKFVDWAANWEFWAVAVGVLNGVPAIRNKLKDRAKLK